MASAMGKIETKAPSPTVFHGCERLRSAMVTDYAKAPEDAGIGRPPMFPPLLTTLNSEIVTNRKRAASYGFLPIFSSLSYVPRLLRLAV
ncbi:MAG: hypothetical protein Kow0047_05920 [Anaerolineae bacterium]